MDMSPADCWAIFQALSDAILIHDATTGEILEVNRGMCDLFGYTPEEARHLSLAALNDSASGLSAELLGSLAAQAAGGSPQVLEWQVQDRAGRIFWVEAHLKAIRLDGRDRILTVLRDIDRRKRAAAAQKERDALYRLTTEGSLAGVYVIQDGGFAYVNPTMAQTFGYQPEDIIARRVEPKDLIHPEDLPLVQENIRRRLSGELEAAHYIFRGRHRDGSVIYCESFGRAVEYQGRPAIVGTLLDITERRRAEEALLTQTRVLESMAEGVTVTGADGKIIYANPAFDTMFGYRPGELIGQPVSVLNDFSIPESRRFAQEMVERLQTKGVLTGEVRNRKKDGTLCFTRARVSALEISGQTCWIAVQEDITARRQMEAALQETQELLNSVLDHAPCAIYASDTDGRYRLVNRAWEQITRKPREEVLGRTMAEVFSATNTRRFLARMQQVIDADAAQTFEETATIAGQRYYFHSVQFPLRDISGQITAVGGVSLDITARTQMEEALRQREASYRVVTENSLAGVYLIQDGRFRYVNPMLAQIFGYSPEDLIDRLGPLDVVHPEDRARIAETMERRLSGEKIGARNHLKGLRQDGSVIYGEVLTRQVDYLGRPAIMGTFIDVTEKRLADEALKASEEKYRTIFNAVNDAIVVIHPETGGFLDCNEKFLRLMGCSYEEALRLDVAQVSHVEEPYTAAVGKEWMHRAVTEGPQLFEWWSRHRSGRRFWAEINLTLTGLGVEELLLAVIRDISDRKQLEEDRRRAYEELEGLVAERTAGLQSANRQLRREIEERRRTEAIIRRQRDLALTLSGELGLHETLRLCLETGISISGLDSGGVYLVNPVSGDLDLAYHQGLSFEFVRRVVHYEADDLNTYLVMAGRPVYARLQDLPGIFDASGLKEGLRAAAIIPVIYQDRVIASLNIASHRYEEVPATARAALETLAAQVGSAMARVQADEALRRAKEDLEIRVAERTTQWQEANARLEEELRVRCGIEQSLRQSEVKYRTLVEQIPAITYIIPLAASGDISYVSPQIETLLEFSPQEWESENMEMWQRQLHPDDRERVLAEITQIIETGAPFAAEYRFLAKSGRVVWLRDAAQVVYDQDGAPRFIQGLAQDITETKRAEEALRETTHTLQTLIKASPLAIIVLDRDLNIKLWNPGAERTFGWQESEVLGRSLPYIPAGEEDEAVARLQRSLAGETHAALELRRRKKDGALIDVQLWTAFLTDSRGEIVGLMGIFEDITERKQVQEALMTSEANYRTIFNGVNDGIGVVDMATGNFLDVNQKWMDMSGYSQEEARGLNIAAFSLPGSAYPPEAANLRFQEAVQEGPILFEWLAQTRDGRTHWVEVNLQRAVINDQERLLAVVRDISERKRAAEALQESERELRRLTARILSIQEQERRRVARELHDELGQALAVLKINLVAIEEKLSAEQQLLKADCEQMLSYIDTVIENVRRLSWDLSPSSLEDLGLSAALEYLVKEICRNHNMHSAVVMDQIDHLFAPETQINIYRIFQESLTNVVKHAGASLVAVMVKREDGNVAFMIRDNGRGFDLRRAKSRQVASQGLGLTAMQERALMTGGSLQVSSRKGQGATIRFSLPIAKPRE